MPNRMSENQEEFDPSKGYCIDFSVLPDGSYKVGEPEPLTEPDEPSDADEEADDETIPDLTQAMKRLLNVIKSNPVGESDEEQFQAGYASPH